MGTDIGELLEKTPVELSDLSNKIVAVDAYNTLYQFLSIIRQRDGTPLKDSKGRVTSHLSGLLYRFTNLLEAGIRPIMVFDGKPPSFKSGTLDERRKIREEAAVKRDEAKAAGLMEEAYKYAQASSSLEPGMVDDSKRLLEYMGIPIVNAPSEGEAQAAYMVIKGDADYSASQDYDSLLFGASRVVRNLTITGKRKLPRKNIYVEVRPEIVNLEETLEKLEVDRKQLIDVAMCVGTDYNPGLDKVGPKTAIKLVHEHGNIEDILKAKDQFIEDLDEKKAFFLSPPVTDEYQLIWNPPDKEKIVSFLCGEHNFSEERVLKAIERLEAAAKKSGQKTLDQWF
ncbi:flap endonuclease-1 [Methanohalophilus levihalophilus]|uniref:flap endonuclease-1 n=1 Tax=Methanohalophilus levihalophilus TaxID=1431282 RepID=UPI001AE9517D|nr:flap endonuclease-1 [Methanohalophilus levihalophilus]MBP2030650.1 flap endonuclease-1 [Methanohalophilus levihalophilus]